MVNIGQISPRWQLEKINVLEIERQKDGANMKMCIGGDKSVKANGSAVRGY